jgi:hypothetical protein
MDGENSLVENHATSPQKGDNEPDRSSESSPHGGTASQELACIEKLLMAEWRDQWGKPLTADELLITGSGAFENLFHEPPLGPIPEYLTPHWSVYGCVAEYEEKLEELDRWKASQLNRWLKDRVGRNWCVDGKVYQLQAERQEAVASEKFWFRLVEDQTGHGKPMITEN